MPFAREFTFPTSGQSVLDATPDPNSVIMYGGRGNTFIYGGGGGDQIAGGTGSDLIYAGTGNDIIHVNDGFNIDLTHPLAQIIAQNLPALTVAHDPSATDSPTSDPLYSTSSQVYLGVGHDIVFLDHGDVHPAEQPDHRDRDRHRRRHHRPAGDRPEHRLRAHTAPRSCSPAPGRSASS